jgi:hypothetical protein
MSNAQLTIIAAIITSPIIFAVFDYTKDKLVAKLKYSGLHAVFLSSGECYFGKVSSVSKNDLVLTEIYYLKEVALPVGEGSENAQNFAPPDLQLIKLGSEIHGPKDRMTISKSGIAYLEQLKPYGQVGNAIATYKGESFNIFNK